jgi:RNA polymerase sigma-70 factor (ECF subfamily)
MSAGAAIRQMQDALGKGVLYLDGGWQTMVDALAAKVRATGSMVWPGARVISIVAGTRGHYVRLADGAEVRAAAVIVTVPPAAAAEIVAGGCHDDLRRRAENAQPVRAACLDLALRTTPRPLAKFALGIDRPLYFSLHSASARLAPPNGALIHAAKYLGDNDADDASDAAIELEALVDRLQPGWRECVVERRFLPNMIVANDLPVAERGGFEGRASVALSDLPGVFLAGDWAGPEALLADASLQRGSRCGECDRTRRWSACRRGRLRAMHVEPSSRPVADLFRDHERLLWGLCYRMTGSAADADDLVQETFVRALEHPPRDPNRPCRPWLVRVTMNLARDHLRRRRRRSYPGPWLPSPIDRAEETTPPAFEPEIGEGRTTAGHYELLESVSFAFLLSLEALTPLQRAVLLLRDVFDYDVCETAEALDVTEANVKTTHHRARRAMSAYERRRVRPRADLALRNRQTLERFLVSLAAQDVRAIESLLADGVRSISDAGGEFAAAHKVVVGRERVTRLLLGLAAKYDGKTIPTVRTMNGLLAALIEIAGVSGRVAPRFVLRFDLDGDGRISEIHSVLATRKLTAIGKSPHGG